MRPENCGTGFEVFSTTSPNKVIKTLLYGNEDGSGHKRNYYLKMTQSGLHKKLLPNYLVKISIP